MALIALGWTCRILIFLLTGLGPHSQGPHSSPLKNCSWHLWLCIRISVSSPTNLLFRSKYFIESLVLTHTQFRVGNSPFNKWIWWARRYQVDLKKSNMPVYTGLLYSLFISLLYLAIDIAPNFTVRLIFSVTAHHYPSSTQNSHRLPDQDVQTSRHVPCIWVFSGLGWCQA